MNNNNDILKSNIKSEGVYTIPSDYFEKLNGQLQIQIEYQKSKPIRYIIRIAATILLIIGIGFIYYNQKSINPISYESLMDGMDEYIHEEDELFYAFTDNEFQVNTYEINFSVDEYLNNEINFY
tara:strand:+ start:307 stop:678 length:372 start_codon:yes stop_codon:yes gene_type:complete